MDKKIISEINRIQQIINYRNNLLLESLPGVTILARVIKRYATQNLDNIIRSSDESISRIFREISEATDEPTIFKKVKELNDLGTSVRGATDAAKAMRTAIRSANPDIDSALTNIVTGIETRITNQGSSNVDIDTLLDTTIEGRFDGLTDDSRDLLKNMIYDESSTIKRLINDVISRSSNFNVNATIDFVNLKKAADELLAKYKNPYEKSKHEVMLDKLINAIYDTRSDLDRAMTNRNLLEGAITHLKGADEGEILQRINQLVNDVANSEAGRDTIRRVISDQGLVQSMMRYGFWKVFRNSILGYILIKGGALTFSLGLIALATGKGNEWLSKATFWMDGETERVEQGTINKLSEENNAKIITALIALNSNLKANKGGLKPEYEIIYNTNGKSLQIINNNDGSVVGTYTLEQINNKLKQLKNS